MWLRPECDGPCEVQLDYDGGWELRVCRGISCLATAGLFVFPLATRRRPDQFTSTMRYRA
jgi:hypothetical protein